MLYQAKPIGNYLFWFNNLYPMANQMSRKIKEAEYLLGYDMAGFAQFENGYGERLPLLSSPFSRHLRQVNRFLFSGGLNATAVNHDSDDPANIFLDEQYDKIKLDALLEGILERGMVTGEILLTFQQQLDPVTGEIEPYYDVKIYDALEFSHGVTDIAGEPEECYTISYIVEHDDRDHLFKKIITRSLFIQFPLIPLEQAESFEWSLAQAQVVAHDYGFLPATVLKNKLMPGTVQGIPEFNRAAIEIATEIAKLDVDMASNHHYFGSPLIASPDPKQMNKDLKARRQVVEKLPNEDGGSPEILNFQPVPETALKQQDRLERSLAQMLGTDDFGSADVKSDLSSLTLRLLNGNSISLAEEKALLYIGGLQVLFGKLLRAAAIDGVIADVSAADPASYKVLITRKKPYFEETPAERSQNIGNAAALVELGIRREVALQKYVFSDLTEQEVLELMEADQPKTMSRPELNGNLFG